MKKKSRELDNVKNHWMPVDDSIPISYLHPKTMPFAAVSRTLYFLLKKNLIHSVTTIKSDKKRIKHFCRNETYILQTTVLILILSFKRPRWA